MTRWGLTMLGPDRVDVDRVMASVDVTGIGNRDRRNEARRVAVKAFLDNYTDYDLSRVVPYQGMSMKEMILDDLQSYSSWEKS